MLIRFILTLEGNNLLSRIHYLNKIASKDRNFYWHILSLKFNTGNVLAVQWLGFRASTARGPGSIPG